MRKLYFFSIFFTLIFILIGCFEYKEVEVVKVTDVSVKEISTKAIDINLSMRINNPNKYDINIVGSDLIIFIEGQKMGTANIKEKVKLKKKSNKIYHFTIHSDIKDLASGALPVLIKLITKSSIELQLQGNIKAKAKGLSKKFPVDFKKRVEL